jgi:hypothetical protein
MQRAQNMIDPRPNYRNKRDALWQSHTKAERISNTMRRTVFVFMRFGGYVESTKSEQKRWITRANDLYCK